MHKLALVVANKNYSSWSLRPWLLLREAGITFEEISVRFADDARIPGIERYSPTGLVPVLLVDGDPVWESLAICETIAELYPEKHLWPRDTAARARARSVCSEMHAGFQSLRTAMPMNIRASYPGKGMSAEVRRDIDRIVAIWEDCLRRQKDGPMLFGTFSVADAMYAPVVTRFATYGVGLPDVAQSYVDAILGLRAMREWAADARRETEFVRADEPYA